MARKRSEKPKRLGKLLPQHKFFLNPYTDARFTRCPKCDRPTKLRKKPLLVLMKPVKAVSINKTCRYCPNCDLLIAHQDELEKLLEQLRSQYFPDFVWEDYLVVGTIERKLWKEGTPYLEELFGALHDFKQHLQFEPDRYTWVKEK